MRLYHAPHVSNRMICPDASTLAGTPKGIMQRGRTYPTLILYTIGISVSITPFKEALYPFGRAIDNRPYECAAFTLQAKRVDVRRGGY